MTSATTGQQGNWVERDQRVIQHPGGGSGDHTLVLSHGKGTRVWDIEGREYLDAQGGAWVNKVGHGRTELAEIAAWQMERLAHFSTGFDYANTPSVEFAEKLIERAPPNIARVRFASGGGEADDHALQLARLYHHRKGNPGRRKILVHQGAYHGGTMGGAELAGGRPGVVGQSEDIIFLTAPRPYHQELYGNRDMTDFCVDELKQAIATHAPETIAAMFGELVIGPGGMIPLPDDYWPRMTAVLKEHGILFVADEIVTAFGRAGAWFTSNDYGLTPDMIVVAKGISSGYMPMAAVLMDHDIAGVTNGLGPGNSYAGHAVAAAVGSAHIDIIERENLLLNSRDRGAQFLSELEPLKDHPHVGDIRGRGLMIGIELVASRESREPLANVMPSIGSDLPRYVRRKHGVLLIMRNSCITLTPPLVFSPEDVSRVCSAIFETVSHIAGPSTTFPDLRVAGG